jgi:nucleoside-diphosphate-sugar epimerase
VSGRVLVTGATGFIGRHAVDALLARGYEVHAVARSRGDATDVSWHEADLLDPTAGAALVERVAPSHLLHLAWYTQPGAVWTAPENLAWAQASLALYSAFAVSGGRRAVLAGTCAEYDWSCGTCHEATTPLRPATLYGACKQGVGTAVTAYGAAHGPSTAWGRVFFLYGPGEPPEKLAASVLRALLEGRRAPVSHGRQVRDFLHVGDVAGAFAALVADETVHGPVNIASGVPISLRDLLAAAEATVGTAGLVAFGEREAAADEPPVILADVTRLRDELGFTPSHTLESGLADALAQLRSAT